MYADDLDGFARLVKDTRAAQILYYQVRSQRTLRYAKDLERRVDEALNRILEPGLAFEGESE